MPVSPPPPAVLPAAATAAHFFRGQAVHFIGAALLAVAAGALAVPALDGGRFLGADESAWLAWSIGLAVLHQLVVWLGFRAQLGWGVFTRIFGARDLEAWGVLFFPLLLARPLTVLGAGLADAGSLALNAVWSVVLGLVCLALAAATMRTVVRDFGMARASGADHFREDVRRLPFVRTGVFRWSPNAMYTFAFLGLWAIALLCRSHVALVAALFQHAFIWLHWVGTEQPDIALIYGKDGGEEP